MKTKRIDEIEQYVKKNETASIDELSKNFNISINTVRRDISELLKRGSIEKVYGGVKAKKEKLVSYSMRYTTNLEAKQKIAQKAAPFIEHGDIVFIDSGTTTVGIFQYVPEDIKCTVITNSLDVVEQVINFPYIKLFIIGNLVRKETRSFVTLTQENVIQQFNINKAFMAATGISLKNGVTNTAQEEYWIKKEVAEEADQVLLLIDNTKFDRAALLTYSTFDNIDMVITDELPDKQYQDFFKDRSITLVC